MPDAVVVLGAGASADFGVPVLRNIFKDRQARAYLEENPDLRASLEDVFWIPRGRTLETSDDSLTVEEMLTALKDWEREEGVEDPPDEHSFAPFRKGLYSLIFRAVFVGKTTRSGYLNPLINFCRRTFDRTTWACFNWDAVFESSFYYSSGDPWQVGGHRYNPRLVLDVANWRQGPDNNELLKLHGSVNWWMVDGRLTYFLFGGAGGLERKWREYDARDDPTDHPVILEPSYYKYDPGDPVAELLMPQWDHFLRRLLEADYVIIIGYSLPAADALARSKLTTAFQVNTEARWLLIDPGDYTCDTYRRVFGMERLICRRLGLSEFTVDLEANIAAAFPGLMD